MVQLGEKVDLGAHLWEALYGMMRSKAFSLVGSY
jgi:hypothetical protein